MQLSHAQNQLVEANNMFTRELGIVENKINQYGQHLEEMEKQLEDLHT